MREIKFRAWNTKTECMYCDTGLTSLGINDGIELAIKDNYILMQYTGLKDKNGKEIYEGDIVRNNWTNINNDFIGEKWAVKFGDHMTGSDYYASGAYGFYYEAINNKEETCSLNSLPTNDSINIENNPDLEVIGNIYENKDLLKEEE